MSATETDDGRVTTFGALCYEEEEEGNARLLSNMGQSAPKRRFGCIRMKSTRRVCLESEGEAECEVVDHDSWATALHICCLD